ncbi:hypothetical protein QBC45DRAFT_452903 [Copromyces sp. CBS 386.78]|nr:hypothetical protein QBC45DRAFT_452903 [Copromyces sp. CBS 386.78]
MAHSDTIDIISSSPEFPDICAPVVKPPPKKQAALRTGSNAAPIPSNSVAFGTFTSAASIWRLEEEKPAPQSPPQPDTLTITTSVSTVAVQVSTTTTTVVSEDKPAKKPRKPRKKKDETTAATDENAPPKPPARRGRPPKQKDADGQTALPKSNKVTKPAAKPRASRKKAETVSKHFTASAHASTADAPVPEEPSKAPKLARIDHEPVDLEPADRRRLDWTPPPDDRPPPAAGNSSTVKELPSSTTVHTDPPVAFGKLLDTYGCKPENGPPSEATKVDVLGKRKLIEMVATTTTTTTMTTDKPTSPETCPTKTKAPKKKPRTITDLATAAYRIQDPVDDSPSTVTSKQDTLLGYIDVEHDKAATKPSGGKTKAASKKPTKPRVSKKKPEPRRQLLLSPQSALRQVSGQDFVFGTSSQLVTEDTDLLRALHESMKAAAGNAPDSDPFTSSPVKFSNLASRNKTGNNKLWKVGARDEDGDLLDLDVFDLTEAVEVPEDLLHQTNRPSVDVSEEAELGEHGQGKTQTAIEILSSDPVVPEPFTVETQISTLSVHRTTKPPPPNPLVPPRARTPQRAPSPSRESTPPHPRVLPQAKTPPRPTTPPRASAVLDFDFDFDDYEPPPSNQEHYQLLEQSQKTSPSKTQQQQQQKKMDPPPRPKYELFTDAQLSREMASYGFKPIKKRAAMISLLEQCWDSKTGATSTGTSTGVDPIAVSPNRAGRGRTAKSATTVQEEAEEAGIKLATPAAATKRQRGRPKKTMTAATATTASPSRMSSTDKAEKADAGGAVHRTAAAASKPANAPTRVLSTSTPKRQRPTMLEIPDSDIDDASDSDPFASSPSASPSASQLFSTPEKHKDHQDHDRNDPAAAEMFLLTDMECDESLLDVTPSTSTEADLFKHITEAITTASRSGNPSDPSWHEKILMYDPIILEDLTGVGWEGEAGTEEVRRWCETKGVGGQVRKRF